MNLFDGPTGAWDEERAVSKPAGCSMGGRATGSRARATQCAEGIRATGERNDANNY